MLGITLILFIYMSLGNDQKLILNEERRAIQSKSTDSSKEPGFPRGELALKKKKETKTTEAILLLSFQRLLLRQSLWNSLNLS